MSGMNCPHIIFGTQGRIGYYFRREMDGFALGFRVPPIDQVLVNLAHLSTISSVKESTKLTHGVLVVDFNIVVNDVVLLPPEILSVELIVPI